MVASSQLSLKHSLISAEPIKKKGSDPRTLKHKFLPILKTALVGQDKRAFFGFSQAYKAANISIGLNDTLKLPLRRKHNTHVRSKQSNVPFAGT